MKHIARVIFLNLLFVGACSANVEEPYEAESGASSASSVGDSASESVSQNESALSPMASLYYNETFKVRGWVREEVHWEVLPRSGTGKCHAGFDRDNDIQVIHRGNGGCGFDGWLSPNDPSDCRAKIWVKRSAGGDNIWNGTCEVSIFEKPRLTRNNSCVNRCGAAAPECMCDPLCLYYGDCCVDMRLACMSP